jgi:hypothetical protein
MLNQQHLERLNTFLDSIETASADYDKDGVALVLGDILVNLLRILNISSSDLLDLLLQQVHAPDLAEAIEDNPQTKEELPIVFCLNSLFQEARLLKLEGKAYTMLDDFFNSHLSRTL